MPNARSIHQILRSSTRDLHEKVDAAMSEAAFENPQSPSSFMAKMIDGLEAVETGLELTNVAAVFANWTDRKRFHVALKEANLSAPRLSIPPISFSSEAEQWGAMYVLEGSRLGSRLLSKKAPENRFLAFSADDRYWPIFLQKLADADERLQDPQGMVRGAEKAFEAFL